MNSCLNVKSEKIIISLVLLDIVCGVYLISHIIEATDSTFNKRDKSVNIKIIKVHKDYNSLPNVLTLNTFKTDNDINNWFIRYGDIDLSSSMGYPFNHTYSLKINFNSNASGEIVLLYAPQYWKFYKYLNIDFINPSFEVQNIEFIVSDYFDNNSWYLNKPHFSRSLNIKPGYNHFSFPVAVISKEINIDSNKKNIHIIFRNPSIKTLYLSRLQLIK